MSKSFLRYLIALSCLVAANASAAERVPYKAMGAPVQPKVAAQWNQYHDGEATAALLKALVDGHPERAKLETLGKSYEGRELQVITITNFAKGDVQRKPGMWIDGCIHANEVQATEVCLYTAWFLLEMYGRNELVTRLVDDRVFYILPILSPDSRDAHFYEPNNTHSPRSGQRPVDDDRDGLIDEDGPDDLDGDGSITRMRIRDALGRWKESDDNPGVMVEVKPGERGAFTMLGTEGFDNDGDGRVNEDGDGSYDPNRNWAWNWQPEYVQGGAHQYPFSILEDRFAADFITAHANIAGAQSYHNFGGMILRGPGAKDDGFNGRDLEVMMAIAKEGEKMLPGYRSMNIAEELYEVYGGEVDWLYATQGIFPFTNELFSDENYFRKPLDAEHNLDEFNKLLLFGEGVAAWREVEHPLYGKVEVGGVKKNWRRQPPSFLLEEECHRNMAFTFYHADQLPQIAFDQIEIQPLRGGLQQITVHVRNERAIPTRAGFAAERKVTRPDLLKITGGQLRVIAGLTSDDRFFEQPKEQPRRPAAIRIESIPGHGVIHARWIVAGTGPFTIEYDSVKAGAVSIEKTLP
ncbi:MAG: M14 family metallopeptidase [Planctomycetia bacterium]|mgnify:CR=1 FL=1|nr:M14 family metallopeptidase [Planctomycetia bacterium]